MANGEDKIKDLFSSKLGGFEPEVPASIWGGLDQILSNQPVQTPDTATPQTADPATTTSSVAGKASLLKTIAIAAGLAAAVITGIMLIPSGEDKNIKAEAPIAVVAEDVKPSAIVQEDVSAVAPKIRPLTARSRVLTEAPANKESSATKREPMGKDTASDAAASTDDKINKPEKKAKKGEPTLFANASILDETEITLPAKGFSVGLMANAGLLSHDQSQRGGNMLFSRGVRGDLLNSVLMKENSEFDLQHRLPVSFGITVSKTIAPRLSFETGLLYTYLSSKVTSTSVLHIDESQVFSYLGVPLMLNYNFYEVGRTRFYISLGGMIQKDIYGKYISNMHISETDLSDKTLNNLFYTEPYYIKKTLKQDNPQFSVKTTFGVAYPLYKKMYLYGTLGGAYYFDAGNEYRTIYSDRQFQLDLNLGIKFDF